MTTRTRKTGVSRIRGRLNRDRIVAAAMAETDESGAFSMRGLGKRLRVDPMAVYRYFHDKDALLDAMADEVMANVEIPSTEDGTALVRLRMMCLDFRIALKTHPGMVERALTPQLSLGPHSLKVTEATLSLLTELGITPNAVMRSYLVLMRFIAGFVAAEERACEDEKNGGDWLRADYASASALSEDLPHIARMASELGAVGIDDQYEFGIDLLLGAISDL